MRRDHPGCTIQCDTDVAHLRSNALRQARALGDELVVGLVSDREVMQHKGAPPVMSDEERFQALDACKWVDEIIRCVRTHEILGAFAQRCTLTLAPQGCAVRADAGLPAPPVR